MTVEGEPTTIETEELIAVLADRLDIELRDRSIVIPDEVRRRIVSAILVLIWDAYRRRAVHGEE